MGRVFDAIRKSSALMTTARRRNDNQEKIERRNEGSGFSPARLPPKRSKSSLFAGSTIMAISKEAARSSASSAHTTDVPDGSALPGGIASRDAGATLDAAGRRAPEDLSAMTFLLRASNLILSRLANRVRPTANSFVRCARASCRPANACRCARWLLPARASAKAKR